HQLIFGSSNTSSRTIGGNTVRLFDFGGADPKIENQSSGSHTINFNVEGDGTTDPLEMNPTSGNLTFGGTVNNQGTDINIFGDNGNTIQFNGVISGTGKFIIKQNSKVVFNAINTYTGNTELDKGELWNEITGDAIASGSSIFLGNGGSLGNVTKIFLSRSAGGTTFSRVINVNNGNASTRFLGGLNSSGTNTFSGAIYIGNTQPLNLEAVNSGGVTDFTGQIRLSSGTVATSATVTVLGAGIIQLSAANGYTGTTTINSGATLRLGVSSTSGTTGPLGSTTGTTVNSGGVLDMNGFSLTSSASESLKLNCTGI
ncbi:MAG: hypothetical protein ACOVP6_07850, partial [Lacibacter sp.]